MGISVDCANVALVARFWAKALDVAIDQRPAGDQVVLRAGALCLTFRKVTGGKVVRNRVRVDLVTDDFELETARLLSLGAVRLVNIVGEGRRWTTFADIEGNEFDLIDEGASS